MHDIIILNTLLPRLPIHPTVDYFSGKLLDVTMYMFNSMHSLNVFICVVFFCIVFYYNTMLLCYVFVRLYHIEFEQ